MVVRDSETPTPATRGELRRERSRARPGRETTDRPPYRVYRSRTRWWPRLALAAALAIAITLAFGVGGRQSEAQKPPAVPIPASSGATIAPPTSAPTVGLRQAAANAALELAGSGDHSAVRWFPDWGLWGNHDAPPGARVNWGSPYWWQSALDLRALIRYLQVTGDPNPIYQQIIEKTFQQNVDRPGTPVPINFGNKFMDDTAWWGLVWVEAARYELNVRGDEALAARFLRVAEWTANYIWTQPRPCHQAGIEWETGSPADTITNAEFVALAGELAYFLEQPGPLYDAAAANTWTTRGWQIVWWLRHVNLANIHSGHVYGGYDSSCKIVGGPLVYTEGEMADALVQMGLATGQSSYFWEAQRFINYTFNPSFNMVHNGVLQQPCEGQAQRCLNIPLVADSTVYKGLFVDAVADWQAATGSRVYDDFLRRQGQAVIDDSASNGSRLAHCQTPHDCQLGLYWGRAIPPGPQLPVGPGSQESGLSALSDALTLDSGYTG